MKLYGLYSEKAAEFSGSVWYSTPNDGKVEVTIASRDPSECKWSDAVSCGEVVDYLGPAKKGNHFSFSYPQSAALLRNYFNSTLCPY